MDKNKFIPPNEDIYMECVDCECTFTITLEEYSSRNGQCPLCHSHGVIEDVDPMLKIHKLKLIKDEQNDI